MRVVLWRLTWLWLHGAVTVAREVLWWESLFPFWWRLQFWRSCSISVDRRRWRSWRTDSRRCGHGVRTARGTRSRSSRWSSSLLHCVASAHRGEDLKGSSPRVDFWLLPLLGSESWEEYSFADGFIHKDGKESLGIAKAGGRWHTVL